MRTFRSIIITTLLLAVGLVFAPPASAAPGGTIDSIEHIGCYLYVTVTVEDAGTYAINAWDDSTFRDGTEQVLEQGATATFPIHMQWAILQGAVGLGIYLQEIAGPTAVETFDSDGSYNDPGAVAAADICATNGGTDSGDPPGATIDAIETAECSATVEVTTTGFGEYAIVAGDGGEVLDEEDFHGDAGERQTFTLTISGFEGQVEFAIESQDGAEEFAVDTADIPCLQPTTTTTTTAAPAVVPVVAVPAAPVTVTPAFTG